MTVRIRSVYFLLLSFLISFPVRLSHGADPLESLITKEQKEREEWADSSGDLPEMQMAGDARGLLVSQSGLERDGVALLCSDMEFDEIMESNQPPLPERSLAVNTAVPRIRSYLQDHCLIRPGDPILAVGPGWQELVTVKGFEVRLDPGACPNDPEMTLWATFDGSFPDAPYFFSTNMDWATGNNRFVFGDDWMKEPMSADLKSQLMSAVSFFSEYTATVFKPDLPGCDRLVLVKKSKLSLDDAELPGEILFTEKDGELQMLLMERVDIKKGSGRLQPLGVLDLNQDPYLDLVVEGVHQGCPYRVFFLGQPAGFEQLDVPIPPCGC